MGVSKALMELAHIGMLSANGLSRTVDSVHRRREQRYYKLYSLFGYQDNHNLLRNQNFIVPTPPTVPQYSEKRCKLSPRMLREVWLQSTDICSALCERVMVELQVTKALQIDHSVKFCKRLKLWNGGTEKRESIKDAKMLLLMQNQMGQIVGRRLARLENNDEMRDLLLHIKSSVKPGESSTSVVSDKASAIHNVVHDVFEGTAATKQDPFHVMQRFSEKVKHKGKRKTFYKLIQGEIYSVDGQLRNPE
ncbi:hypothetical protein P3T76_015938 [Phytophthora citrophthora]|uniref:Uncharacterized protein n=1 Tax=Phytophthora citrophthora TaxID=4793 RepID=A0AAD9FYH9_9STRA|nr:hypothetical protein P3T76_015938 [Phytophthora citrophthora]